MKKILLCVKMPKNNEYVGGIAAIINSYLANRACFEHHNCSIELINADERFTSCIPLSPIRTMCYGLLQYHTLKAQCNSGISNIIHFHTSRSFLYLKDILLGSFAVKRLDCNVILSIHVGDINTVNRYLPVMLQKLSIHLLNKYFEKVIFLSNHIRNQFQDAGLNHEKCDILYNFHDLGKQTEDSPKKSECTRLLFMGMINRDKGILDLLDAAQICGNEAFTLDIGGTITDESIREAYTAKKDALGNKITEWGYVTGAKKRELFESADVLVLPSYHEGLPLVVMEALATGCAMILTPVGAMPEILDETNAVWIKPGDIDGLAKAIDELCSDKEKLTQMQETNRKLGEDYSLEAHIMKLCNIYSSEHAADSAK